MKDFYDNFVDKSIPLTWAQPMMRRPQMYSKTLAKFMKDKTIETMSDDQKRKAAAILLAEREKAMDEILVYYTDDGKMITGKTLRQLIAMGYKI